MTSVAPRWRRLLKPALAYAAAIVLTTASLLLLQHIGHQTPFAVVAKKVAAEFEAEPVAWGTRRAHGYHSWEYCHLTSAVLAGSASSTTPFHDAVVPRHLGSFASVGGDYCPELRRVSAAALAGVKNATTNSELPPPRMPTHQWGGSKAPYAIGLRFVTIHEYHEFIRKATYCAYAALALAVALLGWRALAVASPLLILGAALSGVEYLSDVPKGTPYAWAVFSAALVALLLRIPTVPASATRMFCFVAGMVAGYLWLFDGANFVAAALIGLVAWLRYAELAPRTRAARSVGCVFAHTAGFAVSLAISPLRSPGNAGWLYSVKKDIRRTLAPEDLDILGSDAVTWAELVQLGVRETTVLIDSTWIALGMALLVAGYRAWRRDWGPVTEALGIGVLALAPLVHFLLPNDIPYAAARFMYLPLALCWSVLAAVLLRMPRPAVHAPAIVGFGGALLGVWLVWQHAVTTTLVKRLDFAATDPHLQQLHGGGYFDIHLKDGRQLIYHRDSCDEADMKRRFVLELHPRDSTAPHHGIMFHFIHDGLFTFGQSCTAIVDLPTYPIATFKTERDCLSHRLSVSARCDEGEPRWAVSVPLDVERFRDAVRLVRATAPLVRGTFDVYRAGNELIYLREPCAIEDVRARFFLHASAKQRGAGDGGGSTNLDFDFLDHGVLGDGVCLAERTLPYWDIDRVRTGQFVAGEGEMWATEFPLGVAAPESR